MRIVFALALLLLGWCLAGSLYKLPGATLNERGDGSLELAYRGETLSYVPGVGWYPDDLGVAPKRIGHDVFVSSGVLAALEVGTPRLSGVRSSHRDGVRIVLDFDGLPSLTPLKELEGQGELAPQEPLELTLPRLLLPLEQMSGVPGIELALDEGLIHVTARISGPEMSYAVFTLDEPQRLVVDLSPVEPLPEAAPVAERSDPDAQPHPARAVPSEEVPTDEAELAFELREFGPEPLELPVDTIRSLHPSITHRQTWVFTGDGRSRVDVLEIAPDEGELRVVGESFVPRTLTQLVDGAVAGINASYFDTRDHQSIGLLKVDHTLLSLPSRGRASIGFGPNGPVIDRVRVDLTVTVNGRSAYRGILDDDIVIHTTPGALAGTPSKGALVVNQGTVLENRVGPRPVPEEGIVLVYDPSLRELALADSGDEVALATRFIPEVFNSVRYAVEAGPLLVSGGRPAFDPERESFDTENPESNVNRRASRAAVGLRGDGTVLFVTATSVTAAEMVPIMLSLGAIEALQMDSGGSSTLYAAGSVLNRPAPTQRRIPTAIVFVPDAP